MIGILDNIYGRRLKKEAVKAGVAKVALGLANWRAAKNNQAHEARVRELESHVASERDLRNAWRIASTR